MTLLAAIGGFPGGMELLVVLLVALMCAVVPLALLALGAWYLLSRASGVDEERVEALETEVAELKRQLREEGDE